MVEKNGIESMLKHYIEEVQAVEPVEEQEEEPLLVIEEVKVAPPPLL